MSIADTHEPDPVPNDRPAVWALVISDMQARDAEGRRKYGTPLQPHNGRDALVDAYQEALDLVVYLRQAIEERGAPPAGDTGAVKTLDELAIEADNFARVTFPARSAESISEHLRREAVELAAAPTDAEEMADVFILLGNLVHFTGTNLNAAVVAKLAKNRARKWGKPDAHGVVEHVRDEEQRPAPVAPCWHDWGTDGCHSNVLCRKCYVSKPAPPVDEVKRAVEAAVELLYSVRSARKGSIGSIDNTYLPQIGREWLKPIEERIEAGAKALAARGGAS